MKHFSFLFLFFTVALIQIKAQEKTVFFDSKSLITCYSVTDIINAGNAPSIIITEQGYCTSLKTKQIGKTNIELIAGTKTQTFNRFSAYTFGLSGEFKGKSHFIYTRNGDSIIAGNSADNKHATMPLEQISKQFPRYFEPTESRKFVYVKDELGVKRYSFDFDSYNLFYFPSSNYVTFKMDHPEKEVKFMRANNFLVDSISNNITIIYGRKNKEIKFNEYKDFDFLTYSEPTKIISSFNLKFAYPRGLETESVVCSIENGKPIGKLFIFSYRWGISGKYNDPEKNNFEVVYCDINGNLIFHKYTKFQSNEKGNIQIHGAVGNENAIFIHFNSYNSEGQNVGIIQFDKTGNETYYSFPISQIKANLNKLQCKDNEVFNKTRSIISSLNSTPGLNWNISNSFHLLGAFKTNTNTYFWGQMGYMMDDPDYVPPTMPNGGSTITTGIKPKITFFGEFIIFVYKNDLSFERAYIQTLPVDKEPAKTKMVYDLSEQIALNISIKTKIPPAIFYSERAMNNSSNVVYSDYAYKNFYYPLIINIKGATGTSTIYKDLFLLDPYKSVFSREDINQLYIVGFDLDADQSHYFKVKPVDL